MEALKERGLEATQATVSRDLKELGALKGPGGYFLGGSEGGADAGVDRDARLSAVLTSFVVSVRRGGTTVVLRTGPGRSQPVAVELDASPPKGVLGTIAGDDTIFIAVEDESRAASLCDELCGLAGLAGDGARRGGGAG